MQVSDKEREALLLNTRKELVSLVTTRLVHPDTNRLFPAKSIEEAISYLGYDIKIHDSAKKQASFVMKELASRYYVKKADMQIKLSIREEWITSGDKGEAIVVETKPGLAHVAEEGDGLEHDSGHEDGHEEPEPVPEPKTKKAAKEKPKQARPKGSDSDADSQEEPEEEPQQAEEPEQPKEKQEKKAQKPAKKKGKNKKGKKYDNEDWPEEEIAEKSEGSKALKLSVWSGTPC
jgi:hypothetical protein